MDKKKILSMIGYGLVIVAILVVIMPVIISMGYTYPCEDDFSWEGSGKYLASLYGNLGGAIKGTYNYYISWQGTYLANFIWHFLRPYGRWGMTGFRVVMVLSILLFVFAVFLVSKALAKDNKSMLALALMIFVIAFNTSNPGMEQEFFYWYTGMVNYGAVFSLSCIALALALFLKEEENKKKMTYLAVVGGIVGFLASGGCLQVTSFNCSWLLVALILCYEEIPKKKIIVVPFVSAFVGALINACAKGNFARNNMTLHGGTYGIADALRDTMSCWKNEWNVVTGNKFLLVLYVVIFAVCLLCKTQIFAKGISTGKLLLLLPATFAIQYFTAFPVVLGYHGGLRYARTVYTYELLVKLTILFVVICFAQWLREHVKIKMWIPAGIALVLSVFIIGKYDVISYIPRGLSYNAAKELKNGTLQEMGEFRAKVMETFEQCEKGTDVYILFPDVPSSAVMYGMGLTDDIHSNCNKAAAGYFGFNSLAVDYSDEGKFPEF